MSKTVFVLGAGASSEAGAPLMYDFIDKAEDVRRGPLMLPTDDLEKFDLMLRGLSILKGAYGKSSLDTLNLESVFGAFEMARLLKTLGSLTEPEIEGLPGAMRRVIAVTLEERIRFPILGGELQPPDSYDTFAKKVSKMWQREQGSVSILTFNYDIALDFALHFNQLNVDYGLAEPSTVLSLLKLHGSLNWSQCECGEVKPFRLHEFFASKGRLFLDGHSSELRFRKRLVEISSHCGKPMGEEAYLVPPTWSKGEHHRQISKVWQKAARHLSDAENVFVMGYSLPDTDQFFSYLFALGTMSPTRLRKFWVFNPDESREPKFRAIMGGESVQRFHFFNLRFGDALNSIPKELLKSD